MKSYIVFRNPTAGVYLFCDGVELAPDRAHALCAVKDAYNFGYIGGGPRVLALALLLDALNNAEAALLAHGVFAAEFFGTVAASADELKFSRQQILDWYKGYAIGSHR